MSIAWSKKVSPAFLKKVVQISKGLLIDPSWLMSCMALETGATFSASIKNAAGSGAVGLIQFMPQTALILSTTTEKLIKMSNIDQLDVVMRYFLSQAGKLHNLLDVYFAILWPGAIGKKDDYVLFDQADIHHPKFYIQNKGLDFNHDGKITRAEVGSKISLVYHQGMLEENCLG